MILHKTQMRLRSRRTARAQAPAAPPTATGYAAINCRST